MKGDRSDTMQAGEVRNGRRPSQTFAGGGGGGGGRAERQCSGGRWTRAHCAASTCRVCVCMYRNVMTTVQQQQQQPCRRVLRHASAIRHEPAGGRPLAVCPRRQAQHVVDGGRPPCVSSCYAPPPPCNRSPVGRAGRAHRHAVVNVRRSHRDDRPTDKCAIVRGALPPRRL